MKLGVPEQMAPTSKVKRSACVHSVRVLVLYLPVKLGCTPFPDFISYTPCDEIRQYLVRSVAMATCAF